MKKIFSILLLLLLNNFSVFAAETIKIETTSIPIETEMLKSHYSAYSVQFMNKGKNPVKISNIDIKNIVNNANQVLISDATGEIRKNNKYIYLSLITLGVAGFVGNSKNNKILTKQKAALSEAALYSTQTTIDSTKSEIIMPNKKKTFKILVPLNETPKIESLFQDIKTTEYIGADF